MYAGSRSRAQRRGLFPSRTRECGTPRALAPRLPTRRPRPRAAAAQMRVPLAGGGQETLLSEVGFALLPLFTTAEACALRLVCREFLAAVTEHPWEDRGTVIQGSIAAWRACFPHARCANVQMEVDVFYDYRSIPVVDADFVYFEGLRELYMAGCTSVTDAAFVHLRGIHTLDMNRCCQIAVTDAAFAHLAGIQRLSMEWCDQPSLTDAAFTHLRGVQLLHIGGCRQLTDAAFVHLCGIHTLYMWDCSQLTITDAAFAHLRGIRTLVMDGCSQPTITEAAFPPLQGVCTLGMHNCRPGAVAAAQSLGLPVSDRKWRCLLISLSDDLA